MDHVFKLIIRLIIIIIILSIPGLMYLIFLKPTLWFSFLTLLSANPRLGLDGLIVNDTYLKFIPACIATSAYYLLAIFILFTKDLKIRTRIFMFLLGSLLILTINVFRIDVLIGIYLQQDLNLFDRLHLFFWDVVSTITVVIVWILLTLIWGVKTIPLYSDVKALVNRTR